MVVADDENLDIAREFGFHTVERDNRWLGRKFNDGIEYACRRGNADYVVLIGSDDWMHVDLFDRLPLPMADPPSLDEIARVGSAVWRLTAEVVTGREIAIVDLPGGRLRRCYSRGRYGVIPWVIHRKALEPSWYRPIQEQLEKGIDGSLIAGLGARPTWVFTDPHDLCRVDFKSNVNLNSFEQITSGVGYGNEEPDPWSVLATRYPQHLADLARRTHEQLAPAVAA